MINIANQHVEIFCQPLKPENNLSSFTYTNALLQVSEQLISPVLHFWTLENTVILGLKDQRIPHLPTALNYLSAKGIHYFIRNSGGLAVASDSGILNFSIFLPWHIIGRELKIDEAYQVMTDVVSVAFPEITVKTGEITHSYCPGTFDLSVNGQKIGGMSQRRNKSGVVIMLYLSINGPQTLRGEIIRNFYSKGLQEEENRWHFPDIWPTAMTTIEELIGGSLSLNDAKQRLLNVFIDRGNQQLRQVMWSDNFIQYLGQESTTINRLQERLQREE
ncbi:biotin/lipoate A/B protein ligase family protein [Limosilactobacillus fastidiosus]|uniref:Lipoate--protein ligase family protein n=1 Tax=Limosilactobacillus fastidiosus TaxID=2759855 RepID=A0ABR6E4S9_9LACO|nr:lipoate--protein ligase family protein [Limosilactobacillus fastidiosus]MBB1062205.1 lipoate--protein ligase family protein [Limosilactobacillus fastidiosus]MCD7084423.1 lipoate--protein ligase family protein [Limosilactobacillus fastidiosus]